MNKTTDKATGAVDKASGTATSGVNKATGAATGTLPSIPHQMDFSADKHEVLQWLPDWLTSRWKAADEARPSFADADGKQGQSIKRLGVERRR